MGDPNRPVGPRGRFGVIVPATNTVVEHDYQLAGIGGITFHTARMYLPDPQMGTDAAFEALLLQIRAAIGTAIRDVVNCEPDHLIMGMSAETFWGGIDGNAAFEARIREQSGIAGVSTGATACAAALTALGVHRIAAFSPYQPIADEQVATFFTQAGFDVAAVTGLRCPTATSIAMVGPDRLREVVTALDGPDIDAIVQVGTNLSFVQQAAELERELGKPVVAINAATLWHALRANGIDDRVDHLGRLLRDH